MSIDAEISELVGELTTGVDKIKDAPTRLFEKFKKLTESVENHIAKKPTTDWLTYIHVVGESRAMKSSYILDIYDNAELREYLQIPSDSYNDHTACPCMIVPTEEVSKIKVEKVSITTFSTLNEISDIDEFQKYYSLSDQENKSNSGGYFLRVYIPLDASNEKAFKHRIIEYPGIDSNKFASPENSDFYQRMSEESSECFKRLPGIVVACFKKLRIPPGHPLDVFIGNYQEALKRKDYQSLPLILSFNGQDAVRNNCSGNTDLVDILNKKFYEHRSFEINIQLINPNHEKYPVDCPDNINTKKVDDWINQYSSYGNHEQLCSSIKLDGGLAYSRILLSKYAEDQKIWSNIGYFFYSDWFEQGRKYRQELLKVGLHVENWDDAENILKHVQGKLRGYDKSSYLSISDIYNDSVKKGEIPVADNGHLEYIKNIQDYWQSLIVQYYAQFIPEENSLICESKESAVSILKNKVARELFEDVLQTHLEGSCEWPASTSFKNNEHAEKALAQILDFYLPNQLLQENRKILLAISGREEH